MKYNVHEFYSTHSKSPREVFPSVQIQSADPRRFSLAPCICIMRVHPNDKINQSQKRDGT
jgi:hypothetical protein